MDITKDWIISSKSRKPVIERIMGNTKENKKTGCIELQSNLDRCGYGRIKINGRQLGTHRVLYALVHGVAKNGMVIMHSCDNPKCVNINHLSEGCVSDNVSDCISKGRFRAGNYSSYNHHKNGLIIKHLSTRGIALELNQKYYSGSECSIHKISTRHTNNGECVFCRGSKVKKKTLCPF